MCMCTCVHMIVCMCVCVSIYFSIYFISDPSMHLSEYMTNHLTGAPPVPQVYLYLH
jgi:hypothetical protein